MAKNFEAYDNGDDSVTGARLAIAVAFGVDLCQVQKSPDFSEHAHLYIVVPRNIEVLPAQAGYEWDVLSNYLQQREFATLYETQDMDVEHMLGVIFDKDALQAPDVDRVNLDSHLGQEKLEPILQRSFNYHGINQNGENPINFAVREYDLTDEMGEWTLISLWPVEEA